MAFIIDQLSMITSPNRGTNTTGEYLYRTQDTKATVTTADYFVSGYTQVRNTDTTFKASSVALRSVDRFKVGDIIKVQIVNGSDVPQEFFTIYVATIDYDGTTPALTVTEFEDSDTVTGPASSTDNAVARWNGTTGTVLQNSSVLISDTDAITGATALTVDNINIDGNTISSVNTNGNIILDPNGTGLVVINASTGIVGIIDDDSMATASATNVSTSEATVAYIATKAVQNIATTETTLNYTINAQVVYSKIVSLGALGSTSTITVAHGITGLGTVYDMRVVADNATNQICINGYWTNAVLQAEAFIDDTNVSVRAVGDMTGYTGFATIIYSKV